MIPNKLFVLGLLLTITPAALGIGFRLHGPVSIIALQAFVTIAIGCQVMGGILCIIGGFRGPHRPTKP